MTTPQEAEIIYNVPLSDIVVDHDLNVRHEGAERDIDELADSIREHGQLQPVVLLGKVGKPKYKLIVGQRRFLAHKHLRCSTIRAVIEPDEIAPIDAKIRSLAENLHRSELEYKDIADVVTEVFTIQKGNEKKVAHLLGLSLRKVRQYIYIQERASPETKRRLVRSEVKPVDVERALRATGGDANKADKFLQLVEEKELTPQQKKRAVAIGEAKPTASVREIIEEAEHPVIEENLILSLTEVVRHGLEKATKKMSMTPEDVAARALAEWLTAKGFM